MEYTQLDRQTKASSVELDLHVLFDWYGYFGTHWTNSR